MVVAQVWDGMARDCGQLSLLSSLLLGLLGSLSTFCRRLPIRALVGLHVLIVYSEGLVNLGTKRRLILNTMTLLAFSSIEGGKKTYRPTSSALSISKSIPVIFPASSGCKT
jgi:hypothetical protein